MTTSDRSTGGRRRQRRVIAPGARFAWAWLVALLALAPGCSDDPAVNDGGQDTQGVDQDAASGDDARGEADSGEDARTDGDDGGGQDGSDAVVTPTDSAVGQACEDSAACDAGQLCAVILPGGYCTEQCGSDGACPEGTTCRELNGLEFCFAGCASDADCRGSDGYSCVGGICDVNCHGDPSLCGAGEVCDAGACVPRPPDLEAGDACTSSSACISGVCLSRGFCGEPCTSTAGCALTGWSCQALGTAEAPGEQRPYCAPAAPTRTVESIPSETIDFATRRYTLEVEPDVVSFMVVLTAQSISSVVLIDNVRRPDGTTFAGEIDQFGYTSPFRITYAGEAGAATFVVPNNESTSLQVQPGTWTFDVQTDGSISQALVLKKHAQVEPSTAAFDLNVFIAPGAVTGLSAATAASHSHTQGMLNRMGAYWQQRGMTLGQVYFHDLASGYASIDSYLELRQMFYNQSRNGVDDALNVFLVTDLDIGGDAVGIAGGLPGPVGIQGSGASGVAVMVTDPGYPAVTADNMSHELGHFLGLYHVTEFGAFSHDVIADTAQCSQPPEQIHSFDDCLTNLMFPSLLTGLGVDQSFSSQQGRVMRLNPQGR